MTVLPKKAHYGLVEVVTSWDAHWLSPTEAEQRELRAMWWRQRRLGFTFPAQRGVIVIDGGVK